MKKLLFVLLFIPLISFGQEKTMSYWEIKDMELAIRSITRNIAYQEKKISKYAISPKCNSDSLSYSEFADCSLKWKLKKELSDKKRRKFEYHYDMYKFSVYQYRNFMIKRFGPKQQKEEKNLSQNSSIKNNSRHIIGDTNIEDVNVYDLEAMVKLFLKDCELNNIKLSSDYKITSTFETLDKGVVALAYGIFNDKEIIIKVSPEEWSKASNPKRWYILYHELGHDVLNLQHGQGGKMMFNYADRDYTWDDFFADKDYMFSSMKSK